MLPEQESVARLIVLARRRLKQASGRRAAAFGLSAQQFWVLVHVDSADGPPLCHLWDQLRIDAPTASRIVSALSRRGLLRATADPGDRRRMRLRLTAKGRALAARLRPMAAEVRASVVRDLTTAETRELRRLLHRVIASLDRDDSEGEVA